MGLVLLVVVIPVLVSALLQGVWLALGVLLRRDPLRAVSQALIAAGLTGILGHGCVVGGFGLALLLRWEQVRGGTVGTGVDPGVLALLGVGLGVVLVVPHLIALHRAVVDGVDVLEAATGRLTSPEDAA